MIETGITAAFLSFGIAGDIGRSLARQLLPGLTGGNIRYFAKRGNTSDSLIFWSPISIIELIINTFSSQKGLK
ncbi:MAG UNVERIFIED_CONTAM: hypothetical protein LVR29_05630 [Microcystis novacekii LVE1205-3]